MLNMYRSYSVKVEDDDEHITEDYTELYRCVRALVGRCTCPSQFPIIQVADGKYKIGDSQTLIFVRILRKHVMVRVGGGWDTLENYLDKHDPCRCGFRGHRNSPAPDQIKSTPKRKTSCPNPSVSRPKTPTATRKMTSTPTQHTITNNNKQLIASRRARSPSPNRTVRAKSPFCPTNTNHRTQELSENELRKTPRSTVLNSTARNGFHMSPHLRRSSPSLSDRVMSPEPESAHAPRCRIPEPSRPKTPTYRSQSPGPICKPLAVKGEDYLDSNSRSISPAKGRPQSPAIPRPVKSARNLSPEFTHSRTTASLGTKSPTPFQNTMNTHVKPESPERGRQFNRKSPGPSSHRSHSREDILGTSSLTNSTGVSSSIDRQSSIPTRPKTPVRRPQSPCRIPRPKTPLHSTAAMDSDTSKHKQEKKVNEVDSSKTKSEPDLSNSTMESNGDINIDKISTMSLSEFKSLLSTSLAVPNDNSINTGSESVNSPGSSGKVNGQCSKPQVPRQASNSVTKPPASPKRSRWITSAGHAKEERNLHGSQERVRRSLPASPAKNTLPVNNLERDTNIIQSSQATSGMEDKEENTRLSRPTTPSNINSRLPRPKTPSGIPRPSTPVYSSSAKDTGLKPMSFQGYSEGRDTASSSSSESLLRERSISPQTFSIRPRSPSPPRRTIKPVKSSDQSTDNVNISAATKKQSRLRPPSPSRFAAKQTVDKDHDRGRQANKTTPSTLFRKRPSSAGPAEVANGQRYISTRDSKDENNSYVKRYFGRRNAKTIIKANSVTKAKVTQNASVYSSNENLSDSGNGTSESNAGASDERSRARARSQVSQVYKRPKSAGPRPFIRQEAVDKSSIIVNRGGGGQHSITVSSGETTAYESLVKKPNRPSSAKSRPTNLTSVSSAVSERSRTREVSKSVDLTERRYRTKSAGPRSVPSEEDVRTERSGVCPKVRNKYVSTDNLVKAWEEKISDKSPKNRRQLPSNPRRCVTPGPGTSNRNILRTRSMTPNPVDDQELDSRPLEEIKAALKLPINGIHKIKIDPTKLGAPPEDADLFKKMEDLFQRYREKELSSNDMSQRGGVESASTTSDELDREQASADDEAESVDSNANFNHRVQNGDRKLSFSASDVEADVTLDELENVKIGTSVIAQLTEILKPKPRKEAGERNIKSRIPAPQSRIPAPQSRIPAPQSRTRSFTQQETSCEQSKQHIADQFDYVYEQINGLCQTPINCVNDRVPFDLHGNKDDENKSYLHRDDSSTSLSDVSVSSSQGGYRCETPVPKLATPLCTGRSTLVSLRKERSSSTSSVNGSTTGRLVRAVSLDHSFTSTGNSLVDTSFSLAEDEDYV